VIGGTSPYAGVVGIETDKIRDVLRNAIAEPRNFVVQLKALTNRREGWWSLARDEPLFSDLSRSSFKGTSGNLGYTS
jgi:hypothetical protein